MRRPIALLFVLMAAGCAGGPSSRDMAPYKAVVVFEWLGEEGARAEPAGPVHAGIPGESSAGGNGGPAPAAGAARLTEPSDRLWIEDEILYGLDESGVFSDFVFAEWETMEEVAATEKADLIVVLRIGYIARWDRRQVSIVPWLAALDSALWFGTAIGGMWIPDQQFPTDSDIEVGWRRPVAGASPRRLPRPARVEDIHIEFREREQLASGSYRLSLWNRAKPWNRPVAYLTHIVMPAFAVPFNHQRDVDRSLAAEALQDIQRELAQKLRAGSLRSGGAPFLFRLEEPANGSTLEGRSARLRYRYSVVAGFEDHEVTRLRALRIELKSGDQEGYRPVREYRDEEILTINEAISRNAHIEETIEGLGPGLNLIRFSAQENLGGQWITNTVALASP